MNNLSKLIIAALALGGPISTATAAGDVTDITASGAGLGSFDKGIISAARTLDLTKTFDSLNPITLKFDVVHGTDPVGSPYTVTETITNNTNQDWTDFHFTINEPDKGQGVVFPSHMQSTLTGFTLDASSGPRNLDFTGSLAAHSSTTAMFDLTPFDPGVGTTTFTLTQVPTIPEPETYAMLLAGLGLMGSIVRRRNKSNA